jgi:hypothetical protein
MKTNYEKYREIRNKMKNNNIVRKAMVIKKIKKRIGGGK